MQVPEATDVKPAEQYNELFQVLEDAARFYKATLRESSIAVDYLKGRRVSGQLARDYRLGYAPAQALHLDRYFGPDKLDALMRAGLVKRGESGRISARFRNRIMFPIRDRRGRVIGFGGRALDDSQPKYLNSPESSVFHKGNTLYGLFELRKARSKVPRVIVVEGYLDVLALAQHGILNTVATLGTATTQDHLRQLFRETHELVFCFDGDRAGRQAAWRAVQQLLPLLREGLEARFMFLPEGDDPDRLVHREGNEAFLERMTAATPLPNYFFEHLSTGLDLSNAGGRARLAELAKPLLQTLPEGILKELMHEELAKHVGTSVGKLTPLIGRNEAPARGRNLRLTTSSPVRMAMTMLLNEPRLAHQVPVPHEISALKLPGAALLIDVLETIRNNPHLNSASLVERYRNSEHQQFLLKLLTWRPPAHNYDLLMQFRHTMERLAVESLAQTVDHLLEKDAREGLTPDERRELQEALARKVRVHS